MIPKELNLKCMFCQKCKTCCVNVCFKNKIVIHVEDNKQLVLCTKCSSKYLIYKDIKTKIERNNSPSGALRASGSPSEPQRGSPKPEHSYSKKIML
jgi:hypothetical protein